MNKELCKKKTRFINLGSGQGKYTHPTCVYYDRVKERCTLQFCYRGLKEKGAKA